jgi:hypothetical protein
VSAPLQWPRNQLGHAPLCACLDGNRPWIAAGGAMVRLPVLMFAIMVRKLLISGVITKAAKG